MKTVIQAGKFKGRVLDLPPNTVTRSVSGKVRSAIFNTLGDIDGFKVLDLYAGAGTLGLEALSRGAEWVDFVEKNLKPVQAIWHNIAFLDQEKDGYAVIFKESVEHYIKNYKTDERDYDLVFFDPPYAIFDISIVQQLANLVELGGIVVLSCSTKTNFEAPSGFEMLKAKIYGGTKITYLRRI